MLSGYEYFKKSFNSPNSYSAADDIAQLKREQLMLQPIHEKYFQNNSLHTQTYLALGRALTYAKDGYGVKLTDYNSRIEYGCKSMGLTSAQGCKP